MKLFFEGKRITSLLTVIPAHEQSFVDDMKAFVDGWYSEDLYFNTQCFCLAKSGIWYDKIAYNYRKEGESITSRYHETLPRNFKDILLEIRIFLEEWLKRIPEFRLDPAGKTTWSEGTVRGPRQLRVLFG